MNMFFTEHLHTNASEEIIVFPFLVTVLKLNVLQPLG